MAKAAPCLEMQGICKRFGSTQALTDVSLRVFPGEVHALVGENGAGKSTLMKILSGAERPDRGMIILNGKSYLPKGPHLARQLGVAMIYQELALAPDLTVEANVMLGMEKTSFGFLKTGEHRERVREVLALLAHPEIEPNTIVGTLSPGAGQLVEVARALVSKASIIVFDEPTSSLSKKDAEHLFALIERLRRQNIGILYISHFLEEIQLLADRYTVLRDGRSVATGTVAGTPMTTIIQQMVGRSVAELYPKIPHRQGPCVLNVQSVSGLENPDHVSLRLHKGEILGLFGLVGAGRTELLRILAGLDPKTNGDIFWYEHNANRWSGRTRIRKGIGLLSEDRKQEGLALSQSIADNVTYSRLFPYLRTVLLRLGLRRRKVQNQLEALQVRYRNPEQSVGELSGGNQQKIALARLLHQEAEIFLLDEPTRGVDVGSKAEIYRIIGELAAKGKAILMVSSYLPELLGICDRLAVMARGQVRDIRPVTQWTAEEVMAVATGV